MLHSLKSYLSQKNKNSYFEYALENIICECPLCKCPFITKEKGNYSFTFIEENMNLIYFDVPKVASTSIRDGFFKNNCSLSLIKPQKEEKFYLKFSFVRNPWDRVISNWKMFTQRPMRKLQLEAMTGKSDYSLVEFINVIENFTNHHWLPQTLFVPKNIDFIGRVETFSKDIEKVHNLCRIKYNPQKWKKKKNSTIRNPDYKSYFLGNDELINKVTNLYQKDITRFGYAY